MSTAIYRSRQNTGNNYFLSVLPTFCVIYEVWSYASFACQVCPSACRSAWIVGQTLFLILYIMLSLEISYFRFSATTTHTTVHCCIKRAPPNFGKFLSYSTASCHSRQCYSNFRLFWVLNIKLCATKFSQLFDKNYSHLWSFSSS